MKKKMGENIIFFVDVGKKIFFFAIKFFQSKTEWLKRIKPIRLAFALQWSRALPIIMLLLSIFYQKKPNHEMLSHRSAFHVKSWWRSNKPSLYFLVLYSKRKTSSQRTLGGSNNQSYINFCAAKSKGLWQDA